jgi:hypothetical protein
MILGLTILACVPVAAWLILRFDTWLDRADNAASGFQRDVPYVEPPAAYTAKTETADDFLRGDFDPRASLDRLRADIDAARTEADDLTSPARLRPIPGQRKGENR